MIESKRNLVLLKKKSLRFFTTLLALVQASTKLFWLELKLAKASFTAMMIYGAAFIFIAVSLWFLLILLLVLVLHYFIGGFILPVLILIGIHIILLAVISYYLMQYSDNLYFKQFRKHFMNKDPLNRNGESK